ncbi:MAG: hypothetical protein VB064_04885, partial [Oscillospiraceae bacterium]|nr:hypothetical protein [Oscillospiraceae bacterium]
MKMSHDVSKKAASAIMAFVLLAGLLTGCGGSKEGNKETLSEYVYVPQYSSIPEEVTDISNPYLYGDTIYFNANMPVHADGTPATQAELDAMYGGAVTYKGAASSTDVKVAVAETTTAEVTSTSVPVEESAPGTEAISDITYKNFLYAINRDGTDYHKLADYVPKAT